MAWRENLMNVLLRYGGGQRLPEMGAGFSVAGTSPPVMDSLLRYAGSQKPELGPELSITGTSPTAPTGQAASGRDGDFVFERRREDPGSYRDAPVSTPVVPGSESGGAPVAGVRRSPADYRGLADSTSVQSGIDMVPADRIGSVTQQWGEAMYPLRYDPRTGAILRTEYPYHPQDISGHYPIYRPPMEMPDMMYGSGGSGAVSRPLNYEWSRPETPQLPRLPERQLDMRDPLPPPAMGERPVMPEQGPAPEPYQRDTERYRKLLGR